MEDFVKFYALRPLPQKNAARTAARHCKGPRRCAIITKKREVFYMKKLLACVLGTACLLGLAACGRPAGAAGESAAPQDIIADKTFVYEKEGAGGEFAIQINGDGTFSYSEGLYSSYIGAGSWSLDEDILVLSDDEEAGYPLVNRFKVQEDGLVFLSEDSSNFLYVDVADGDCFVSAPA